MKPYKIIKDYGINLNSLFSNFMNSSTMSTYWQYYENTFYNMALPFLDLVYYIPKIDDADFITATFNNAITVAYDELIVKIGINLQLSYNFFDQLGSTPALTTSETESKTNTTSQKTNTTNTDTSINASSVNNDNNSNNVSDGTKPITVKNPITINDLTANNSNANSNTLSNGNLTEKITHTYVNGEQFWDKAAQLAPLWESFIKRVRELFIKWGVYYANL